MKKNCTVRLVQDSEPENPRECENLGKMACWHRRYSLGDSDAIEYLVEAIQASRQYRDSWGDYGSDYYRDLDDPSVLLGTAIECRIIAEVMPLYLYDHSGITMNTTGFHCPWDSGQVGYIYTLKSDARNALGVARLTRNVVKQIRQRLVNEVSVYDDYLRGDVYGFEIVDQDGDIQDSCYGFYGDDVEKNGMLDYIPAELRQAAKAAVIEYHY